VNHFSHDQSRFPSRIGFAATTICGINGKLVGWCRRAAFSVSLSAITEKLATGFHGISSGYTGGFVSN
jgi:hypothetical protein